jgi:hypothetical protein
VVYWCPYGYHSGDRHGYHSAIPDRSMSSVQFGTFTEEVFITLVRSRFQALDVMDAGSPQQNFLSDALDSEVKDHPSDYEPALLPSALAVW